MIRALSDGVPPLTPDGDQARRWAEEELRDPVYAAAHPTPLDRIARAVQRFFSDLFSGSPDAAWGLWLAVAVAAVLVALIVISVVLSSRGRLSRRSTPVAADLFGDVETRSAAQLRRAAASAAARQDWSGAVILRFRAAARDLVERGLVELVPGSTVHAFAQAAARVVPEAAGDLEAAANAFDDVRYLRRPGTPELYARVAGADERTRSAPAVSRDLAVERAG